MRILSLLSSSSVTGPAELCLDDARELRRAGHEVLFGCNTRQEGNYVEAIRAAGFTLMEELTLCRNPKVADVFRDVARLRKRLRDADVVHCRFSHDHTVAMLALQGLRRPPALVRTAEIAASVRPGLGRRLAFRACRAVIVPCRDYAERLVGDHGVAAERVHVLGGRVDATRFCPGDGGALRRELGIGDDEVLFGIVSRIKVERLHGLLVRGFAQMAAQEPKARLAIVGRGEYEPELRALVAELGLQDRVHFAGYRTGEQLVEAYRAFDAKVWLAEGNDGTCRAVLEAMACGKPVLVGDQGAMKEVARDGVDGFVVPREESAIADALRQLCDPERRAAMGAQGRARAAEFSAERRAERLLAIYKGAFRSGA